MKRPAFQFYPADWRKDPALSACSLAARGLWMDLMCIAHEAEQYGYLTIGGKPMSELQLARLVGEIPKTVGILLAELEQAGVFSKDERGAIYSRRMVKDERLRNIRAEAGRLGGNPNLVNQKDNQTPNQSGNQAANQRPKQPDKQKPTPSSSSSSSTSTTVEKEDVSTSSKRRAKTFQAPTLEEVRDYFQANGYRVDAADKAFAYYEAGEWKDAQGKAVKSWKQKMQGVWFKDENRELSGNPAAGEITEANATWAIMRPPASLGGSPERWNLAEYQRLQHVTEYQLLGYE